MVGCQAPQRVWLHKQKRCELYTHSTSWGYKYNTVFAGLNPPPLSSSSPHTHPQLLSVILAFRVLAMLHGHKTKRNI
jgi:hypothetical protein